MTREAYLQPGVAPRQPPSLESLHPDTRRLHCAINHHASQAGTAYLHPTEPSVQIDLQSGGAMTAWQEAKTAQVMLQEGVWSELPQIYARYGTEEGRKLITAVRQLEEARGVVLTDSGMQAIALLVDTLATPNGHALVSRQVYNKTKAYLNWLSQRWCFDIDILEEMSATELEDAVKSNTCLVLVETFTNPLMRALDPEAWSTAVSRLRKTSAPHLKLIVDNTIATPWGVRRPLLEWPGIAAVVNAGTKALGGQDLDIWGYIASNDIDLLNRAMDHQAMRGGVLSWRVARAVLQGLPQAQQYHGTRCDSAVRIANFLAQHPQIEAVFHPSLPNHPDREVITRHYARSGSLIAFRLKDAHEQQTSHFCDVLASTGVVRYALSFDGLCSKINHHKTVSEFHTPEKALAKQGIERLARLAVGIEDANDIIACLNWALCHHRSVPDAHITRNMPGGSTA